MKKDVKSNIWKYYLVTSLAMFGFYTPIIQLFYLDRSLTITKIALLGVIWSLTRLILEIPSSILADRWGRKKVMFFSTLFAILQLLFIILAQDYLLLIFASVFSAASYAFISGTDVAFFYDSLKQMKREKEFEKLWAKQQIYQQIPLVISFVSAGFLYTLSSRLPFQLSLLFLLGSLLVLLTLKEPDYHKPIKRNTIYSHLTSSLKVISKNRYLRAILILTLIFSLGSDLSYGYGQIYLKLLSAPVYLFGFIYLAKSLFVTLSANIAPYLRRKSNYKYLFSFIIFLIIVLLLVMVVTDNYLIGAIFFILIAIPHGLFGILKTNFIHQRIASHNRATIDSIFSLSISLMFLIVEPIVGYLSDLSSIKLPFIIVAVIMLIYWIYFILIEKRNF